MKSDHLLLLAHLLLVARLQTLLLGCGLGSSHREIKMKLGIKAGKIRMQLVLFGLKRCLLRPKPLLLSPILILLRLRPGSERVKPMPLGMRLRSDRMKPGSARLNQVPPRLMLMPLGMELTLIRIALPLAQDCKPR